MMPGGSARLCTTRCCGAPMDTKQTRAPSEGATRGRRPSSESTVWRLSCLHGLASDPRGTLRLPSTGPSG